MPIPPNIPHESFAEWPPEAKVYEPGLPPNTSSDNHPSQGAALAVCHGLMANGFGGDRKIFPIRTWVKKHVKE